ncbi:MAG: type IV toxin-antitoxin system AbiEi family antitoxin domain-containing protein [Chitinispirillia bacterium]|nr:type IV toxin-antitoxin system AbiEi family antitoxin domain-containing protein [Chitinispirillia bacterium]MCL2267591.1 type IV toxin-antitoxin system AbiEi family antitoxin domain-containing protein [Chitinispirillia bacterium]
MSQRNLVCRRDVAIDVIKARNGWIKMAEAMAAGINRRTLYSLRDDGVIELVSRGVYRLSDWEPFSQPDKAAVALRVPGAVVCLTSALSFHEITTQIPNAVDIAVLIGSTVPCISYPPVRVYRLREPSFGMGIVEHVIDGVTVKIYDVEKTLCDCFKFRRYLGMDIVLEALKLYRERKPLKVSSLMDYARACRVERVIRPYLEVML